MNLVLTFVILLIIPFGENALFKSHKKSATFVVDEGDPLILTPLIEANDIASARQLSEINSDIFKNIKSYSGYFTVDKKFNSNTFFWFVPSENDYDQAPVLLWLNGGPGSTSLWGLFTENGPYIFNKASGEMELRKYSWHKSYNMLYIDNPVGTGYSFTEGGYAQNETIIGEHLYSALQQFFIMFPELQSNEFVATGESYAGKYIPAICYTIHKKNPEAEIKINLKGFAIGNGLCHPELQLNYSDYLYQLGLVDIHGKEEMLNIENSIRSDIKNSNFIDAFNKFDALLNADLISSSVFTNLTGFTNYYNYLVPSSFSVEDNLFLDFITRSDVKKEIHVGGVEFGDDNVEINLKDDVMRPVTDWLSELLNNYRGLIYNGQLDIIVAYPLTTNYLKVLNFNGADDYKVAQRSKWCVGEDLAGYVKKAGNLTEVLVRNAGHMVPQDQPQWAFDLITKFINNLL